MAAYLEQAAAAAAGQVGGSSRSKRRADAPSAASSAKGRGRGRGGRGRGKAAADPEEPAEPPAAPEESAAAVPPAVVEQVRSPALDGRDGGCCLQQATVRNLLCSVVSHVHDDSRIRQTWIIHACALCSQCG